MAAKRGAKRAASGGAAKKRGRPNKKQKEEEKLEEKQEDGEGKEGKENEDMAAEEQQPAQEQQTDSNKDEQSTSSGGDSSQLAKSTSTQSTDDAKTDDAKADDAKSESTETAAEPAKQDDGAAKGAADGEYAAEELEKGRLYFFYRPKVDAKEVKGTGDVQKFYILMSPEGAEGKPASEEEAEKNRKAEREAKEGGSEGGKQHRLLVVSSKMLPPPGRARNPWSFVDAVGSLEDVEHKLERYSYDTKTRGHREIEPARLCGEARYELIKQSSKGNHSAHLVYELEVPEQPGEVQRAFSIEKEGQFLVNVKNPDFNSAARSERPYAGFKEGEKAKIPSHLMELFKGKRQPEVRYAPAVSTEFFELHHAELVLLGVTKGVKDETGDGFQALVEQLEDDVEADHEDKAKVYEELKTDEKEHPATLEEFK